MSEQQKGEPQLIEWIVSGLRQELVDFADGAIIGSPRLIAIVNLAHLRKAESNIESKKQVAVINAREFDLRFVAVSIAESERDQIETAISQNSAAIPGYIQANQKLDKLTIDLRDALGTARKRKIQNLSRITVEDELFNIRDRIIQGKSATT